MKKPEPLILLKDSREPIDKYLFKSAEFKEKVLLIRTKLDCGDFSVLGADNKIFIERKTTEDLISSFTHGRERFKRMWERSAGYQLRYLMIEGNLSDILAEEYRSVTPSQCIIGSIMSWSLCYSFSWFIVSNIYEGQKMVYRLLLNYKRLKEEGRI